MLCNIWYNVQNYNIIHDDMVDYKRDSILAKSFSINSVRES